MRTRTIAGGVLAALVLVAGGAEAADDPGPALRADVDALVQAIAESRPDDDASPTARVNRLLAAGEARLRPVLEETWYVVTTHSAAEEWRGATRRLVRFLYSFPGPGDGAAGSPAEIVEVDGVVRIRRRAATDGPGEVAVAPAPPEADTVSQFRLLVRGGRLRAAARPDLKKAFAALGDDELGDEERAAIARAIGESCAASQQAVRDLTRRFEAESANPWLATALAWSGAPAAEALRGQAGAIAGQVAQGKTELAPRLAIVCRALAHLRRAALVDAIVAMPDAARREAMAAAGTDVATSADLAALAKAPDAAAKRALVEAICRRLRAGVPGPRASGRTLAAIAGILVSSLDSADDALRAEILGAAERVFHGRSAGVPCPGVAETLASLAKDLASGDLAFAGSETTIFDVAERVPRGERMPLLTDVRCPDPERVDLADDQRAPVRIRGVLVAQWLRLSLTNASGVAITVNPVALRYATSEYSRQEVYGGPGGDRHYVRLSLRLGCAGPSAVTSADRLVTLQPTESYSWTITLPAEQREADHVCVELTDGIAVRGKPAAPLLTWFLGTWVK